MLCYFCESGSGVQSVVRCMVALFLSLGSVVAVAASWATATAIPLLAAQTTALIMGGTSHPLVGPKDQPDFVTSYLDHAVGDHLNPAFGGPVTNAVAVFTPEELFPIGELTLDESVAEGRANLHRCVAAGADCVFNDDAAVAPAVGVSTPPQPGDALMVFGYSQSSIIASLAKQDLIADYQAGDSAVSFMLVANPMRPNGGVLMRGDGLPKIPIMGISFVGASPTDSALLLDGTYVYPTVDIARQYDGLGGDFPVRPLNLLALANALLGYYLLHGETVDVPLDRALYQGREGDTSYYLIETGIVPILQPLAFMIPEPILRAIDVPLRVMIEDAYDRSVGPGTPTPLSWWPTDDVFGMAHKLIRSLPVAVDTLFEGFGLSRVLGTEAPGPYGVGGPDLPDEPGADPDDPAAEPDNPAADPADASVVSDAVDVSVDADADKAVDVTDVVVVNEAFAVTAVTGEGQTVRSDDSEVPGDGVDKLDSREPASPESDSGQTAPDYGQAAPDSGLPESDAGLPESDPEPEVSRLEADALEASDGGGSGSGAVDAHAA